MKNFILKCGLYAFRGIMSFIYFFIKLFPINPNKVIMISRQSNKPSIDFKILESELLKNNPNIQVKIMCKKMPKKNIKKIGYFFYMIKCMYHIATSGVCIVEGYVIPVCILKHKKKLIIIQIWHALGAIKKFGRQIINQKEGSNFIIANIMKMHKNYTFVTCTSNATKKFYEEAFGIEKEKIHVIGMPRIDYLLGKNNQINENVEKLLKQYPKLKEKKNILYVPTFRQGKHTPIQKLIKSVDETKYNLIIRLHPLEKIKVNEKYTIDLKYNTFDLLKIADYVITDYSAIAFEALVVNKPVFFYLYDLNEYKKNRGLNIDLYNEMKNVTFSNIDNIISIINENKYPFDEYKKFKSKYIETLDTDNTKRIIEKINQEKDKKGKAI